MNFLSVLYAKAGITVDGVTALNNTATALTPTTSDSSTKIATTAFVKNQNYYPYPTGTTSQYVRGDGSLATFPTVAAEAKTLITEVYNETGATLTKGTVVYINGGHGNLPTITKALANSDATSAQTYGVVQNDITDNNNGFVVVIGSLTDLDTFAYANGTILYLSPTTAGAWTSTKPYAPQHIVYVGIVVRSHPTQGVVEIKIQNGYEMDELHNVSAQSPANGDILQFNYSTQLWTKTAGTTTNITEGTNLYYTDARSRAAFSEIVTGLEYNSTTGVLSLTTGYSIPTTASQSTWDTAYNDSIVSAAVTGTTTKTLTLTQQDGGTITASWSDLNTDAVTSVFGRTGAVVAASGDYTTTQVTEGTNLYFTDARARAAISLTTTGTSGAATYSGGVLNIPQYQAALTNPVTGTGTTNYLPKFTGTSTLGDSSIFDNGTNVGIGTTNPTQKVTIGNGAGTGNQYVRIVASGSDIYIGQSASTIFGQSANSAGYVLSDNTSFPFVVGTIAAQSLIFGTNTAERMRIFSDGNVAINSTTNAGYKLDVNGTARVSNNLTIGSYDGLGLKMQSATSTGNTYLRFYNSAGTARGYFGLFWNGSSDYMLYDSGTLKMSFESGNLFTFNGSNVLIGTTTDSGHKLNVNGTAKISNELRVQTNASAISLNSNDTYGSFIGFYTTGPTTGYIGNAYHLFGSPYNANTDLGIRSQGNLILSSGGGTHFLTLSSSTGVATFNSGTTNQNTTISGSKVGMSRTSDGAEVVYFSKNTDLGTEGTANIQGYNGIQFRTQGAESVKLTIAESGAATFSSSVTATSFNGNATTATNISNAGTVTLATATESNSIYITQPSYTTDQPVKLLNFAWYSDVWQMGNIRTGGASSAGFGIYLSGTEKVRIGTDGRISNLAWTTTGRNYSNEWIEFPNYTGLYSANNNAHFLPNGSSYGAWKVQGSRNGWGGLEFEYGSNGNISLMIAGDSSLVGFHNNSYSWQFYWSGGTMYVGKGANGGSTVPVLDASNVGSYAVKLYGTINNNIDSDYGECFVTFDPIPSGTPPLASPNIRTINVGNSYSRRTQLAFDYASDKAYFRRRTEAGWFTWREFVHSGNVDSYALPISGGILTGLVQSYAAIESDIAFRTAGNFELTSGLTGLKSNYYDTRFYANSVGSWVHSTAAAATGGSLEFRQGFGGTVKGYTYWDSSGFGLLNNNGGWSVRANYGSSYGGSLFGSWVVRSMTVDSGLLSFYTSTGVTKGSVAWDDQGFGLYNNQNDYSLICNQGSSFGGLLIGTWSSTGDFNIAGANLSINSSASATYANITYSSSLDPVAGNWYSGMAYDAGADETYYYIYYIDGNQFRLYADGTIYINGGAFSQYTATSNYISVGAYGLYSSTYSAYFRRNDASSYAAWELVGAKGGYTGMYYSASNQPHIMFNTSNGNGGLYYQTNSRWILYYDYGNNSLAVGGTTSSASYKMYVTGAIYATGAIVANSDGRNKENVELVENALDKVNSLRGVTYTKKDQDSGKREMGVIAQEVLPHVPEVIQYAEDLDQYGVSYGNFAGLFIEAIKEQQVLINELKAEIEILKNK